MIGKRISLQDRGERRTSLGVLRYIRIQDENGSALSWPEIWEKFSSLYPYHWAIQFFPPVEDLVDECNIYHLWVLPEAPTGVSINPLSRSNIFQEEK